MEYLSVYASIALIHLLAIASPGPTFMVVAGHAAQGGRAAGLQVVAGVMVATLAWIALAVAGLGGLLAASGVLQLAVRVAAAVYLAWMGFGLLRSALRGGGGTLTADGGGAGGRAALRTGFRTNIANPKVVLYYASLFGAMVPAGAPSHVAVGVGATAFLVSLCWWIGVVVLFGLPTVRRGYAHSRRVVDAGMGVLLIVIAGRVLGSR